MLCSPTNAHPLFAQKRRRAMKYKIEFELPDNEVVQKEIKHTRIKWMVWGYDGYAKAIPSADRPQGEWIESFKRVEVKQGTYIGTKFVHDGWSCSECSEVVEKRYPNCPYCLARMKGAER